MDTLFAVDRFEDEIAVLVGDDGAEFKVGRPVLPVGVHEGSMLRVPLGEQGPNWSSAVIDEAERRRRDIDAQQRLGRLRSRDPGGDIEL